jgi:hypothetical protein
MSQTNLNKLKSICEAFHIPVVAVARTAMVSRPTASRVIHGSMVASSMFWRNLELNLFQMIRDRSGQIFEIPAVDAEKVERLNAP